MDRLDVSIGDVVTLLGLKREPRSMPGDTDYHVVCPFCGQEHEHRTRYTMHIDEFKNCYYCYKCSGGDKGTGVLDLYGRVRFGTPHRKGRDGNGTALMNALKEELSGAPAVLQESATRRRTEGVPSSAIAKDDVLDKTYSFFLGFSPFALSAEHGKKLLKRGLNRQTIARNGYRTIPADTRWVNQYPKYVELYDKVGIEAERAKNSKTRDEQRCNMVASFVLGCVMRKEGLVLKGVPGAFRMCGYWLFRYEPGMFIPTRNMDGQIVCAQIRKDTGNVRYKTLSSSGRPYAVQRGISRVHFPLANSSPQEASEVLVTEGPLKADVAAFLYKRPVLWMALHGANNTRDFADNLPKLASAGVAKVGNALDMDKLTNPNVQKACVTLRGVIRASGLGYYQKLWDESCAKRKVAELGKLCEEAKLDIPPSDSVFVRLASMTDALRACKCKIPSAVQEWDSATKGIDDYLNSMQR